MTVSGPAWEVPQPLSTHEARMEDGTGIVLRRHGNPDGLRLVMSHGNGLAIDLYYPFWSLLAKDYDLIVYDQRNHGWNTVSTMENHNIPTLVSRSRSGSRGNRSPLREQAHGGHLPLILGPDDAAFAHEGERICRAYPVRSAPVQTW